MDNFVQLFEAVINSQGKRGVVTHATPEAATTWRHKFYRARKKLANSNPDYESLVVRLQAHKAIVTYEPTASVIIDGKEVELTPPDALGDMDELDLASIIGITLEEDE